MFFKAKQEVGQIVVVVVFDQLRPLVQFLLKVTQGSFLGSFIEFGKVVSEMFY